MRGAILVLLGALGACAGRNPPAGTRIDVGAARLELGSKDAPLRLAIHPYRQGAARGELWVAVVDPARAHLAVVPAPGGPMAIGEYGARGADFAAINGGFYDNEGAMGLVVSDGRLVHPVRKGG